MEDTADTGGNNNMASGGNNNIFNRIDKFSGNGNIDFASWLRTFDRACTIALKTDDLVKGQIMMTCLTGQAMAFAENLELRKNAQQPYSELKTELEKVFNSAASREARMVEFDNRIQRVNESEDEFMLSLVRLYKAANPDVADATASLAVKRKFMQGITAELRRSTYIFCSDPFSADVTYQQLLEGARKARLQLAPGDQSSAIGAAAYVTNVSEICGPSQPDARIMQAIDNLSKNFSERLDTMEMRFNNQLTEVNSISNNNNNYNNNYSNRGNRNGGGYRGNNRYNNNQRRRGNNRNNNHNSQQGSINVSNDGVYGGTIICFKCGGPNHKAFQCQKN